MDITPQEAFKLGFLARCAEEQLTGSALNARLEKVADFNKSAAVKDYLTWSPVNLSAAGTSIANTGLRTLWDGLTAAWAVPPAAAILGGGALGYGTAKMVEPPVHDDEIKAQEIADTYKLYAEKARARKKMRKYRMGNSTL
jgi:hypothetical protein